MCACASTSPGITVARPRSITRVVRSRQRFASARVPTAPMRWRVTASAETTGRRGSSVTMRSASRTTSAAISRPFALIGFRIRRQVELDVELAQSLRRDFARRLHQEILRLLVERKRDHFADVPLAGEHHHDAINTWRRSAVRRRAELERVQQPSETRFDFVLAVASDLERLVHDLWLVVPDRPAGEL